MFSSFDSGVSPETEENGTGLNSEEVIGIEQAKSDQGKALKVDAQSCVCVRVRAHVSPTAQGALASFVF